MSSSSNNTAVILAGAVANGAFEAGALEVVADSRLPITRVLGTSSGALNATLFTRFLLAGEQKAGAEALVKLWKDDATWWRVFRPSLRGILTLTGFSNQNALLEILRKHVLPVASFKADVELRIVVTSLKGRQGEIGDTPATTHEDLCRFDKSHFASQDQLNCVLRTAAASSAFPGAFLPVHVHERGLCADGGIVNNTPVKHVLGDDVTRLIVIVPSPRVSHEHAPDGIGALVGRIADIIVQERLYRDLREAEQVNAKLAALNEVRRTHSLRDEVVEDVKVAVGLAHAKALEIVEIRPTEVPPNPFAGLFSRRVREALIDQGRKAALEALSPKTSAPGEAA
jgi:NTE family protein